MKSSKPEKGIPAKLNVNYMRIAEDLAVSSRLLNAASAKWTACRCDENARLYVYAFGEMRRCVDLAEKATREGVFIPAGFAPDEVALAE